MSKRPTPVRRGRGIPNPAGAVRSAGAPRHGADAVRDCAPPRSRPDGRPRTQCAVVPGGSKRVRRSPGAGPIDDDAHERSPGTCCGHERARSGGEIGATLAAPHIARAQEALDTLKILVGFPLGGSADVVSRQLADKLAPAYGRAPPARPGSACGSGSRASSSASGCSVGTSSSRMPPRTPGAEVGGPGASALQDFTSARASGRGSVRPRRAPGNARAGLAKVACWLVHSALACRFLRSRPAPVSGRGTSPQWPRSGRPTGQLLHTCGKPCGQRGQRTIGEVDRGYSSGR